MKIEYEVRILEINQEDIIARLDEIGAKLKGDYLQKRYVYDFKPKQKGKWLRLRTNGDKTTLTIKNITSSKMDGTKELEIEVEDFDKMNLILKELGYTPKGYQENRRIQYLLDGVEVDIDMWPLIPTYLEVEGETEKEVYDMLKRLGISKENITTNDVEEIYLNYGYDLNDIYILKLEEERK